MNVRHADIDKTPTKIRKIPKVNKDKFLIQQINSLHKSCSTFNEVSNAAVSELILGLRPANKRRRDKVTPSLISWVQT